MIKSIYIIGFPKCGSTSLREYLKEECTDVNVRSFPGVSLYHKDWERRVLGACQQPDVLSVIITRNPIYRTWSAYWWSKMWGKDISFKEFLARKNDGVVLSIDESTDETSGISDPIGACDYSKYIKKASTCNPIVMKFEEMIKVPSFPHEAKTDGSNPLGKKKLVKPKITDVEISMIKKAFDDRGVSYEY